MLKSSIELLSQESNNIYIMREDLLPRCFGGNKYRIAETYINDLKSKKKNSLIAYGNPRSNLCRTLSFFCLENQLQCYIVSPSDDNGVRPICFNEKLSVMSGATIVECNKTNVAETIDKLMTKCRNNGEDPYYIYGDKYGKGNERVPVQAYIDVYVNQLDEFVKQKNIEYIFLPIGTGMTAAGLKIGSELCNGKAKIVGISIAREKQKALSAFSLYYYSYYNNDNNSDISDFTILDDYLLGGYGKYDKELSDIIVNIYARYGIAMDPTYVGKAFWGMNRWIDDRKITGKNILFIHTGGLPIWFDYINGKEE